MSGIHVKKIVRNIILILLIYQISLITPSAAIGEASMSLYVYVPPGGSSEGCGGGCTGGHHDINSATYIIVTATLDDTVVDIIDLDTTIGDPTHISSAHPVVDVSDVDLSEYNVHLDMGQSRVIKVSYAGDSGAPDSDGTYFHVSATKPVTVYTGTAVGKGQADFVPSNNGTMIGHSFFVYLPDCYENEYDLAVFAYEDNTNVSVFMISSNQTLVKMDDPLQLNATTSIDFSSAILIANKTLCPITPSTEHPPTLYRQALKGNGIEGGYTYMITADKNISVASVGTLNDDSKGCKSAGDGAYFVPGISVNPYRFGTGLAHTFYMQLNGPVYGCKCNNKYENEIYLINYNSTDTAYVTIEEYNPSTCKWEPMPGEAGNPNWKFYVSNSSTLYAETSSQDVGDLYIPRFNYQGLVRITSNDSSGSPMDISVFSGVSSKHKCGGSEKIPGDIAAFSSGDTGYGGSKETILYIPPPVYQTLFSKEYTHAYIYIYHNNTNLTIQSWKDNQWQTVSLGEYTDISKDQIIDYRIDDEQWEFGKDGEDRFGWDFHKLRVLSTKSTTVQVSNWKNNWASYVPGGTVPQFTARVTDYNRHLTINTMPAQRVRYSFEVDNAAIGTVGSNLIDLSVINMIPDGIDQTNIYWSVTSNMAGFECNSSTNKNQSTINNGTKYVWKDDAKDIEVTAYAYDNGSGTIIIFNRSGILKSEVLAFNVYTPLSDTYSNGQKIHPGIMIIGIGAEAENPFLGLSSYTPLPPTIILSDLNHGVMSLY